MKDFLMDIKEEHLKKVEMNYYTSNINKKRKKLKEKKRKNMKKS